jgi:hypothetical protein
MNLASAPVLGLAAVMSSPALYMGLVTGDLPLDVALTRYLVAVVVVWVGLSVLAMLVGSPPRPEPVDVEPEPEPAPQPESPAL